MFKNTLFISVFLALSSQLLAFQAPDFTITDSGGKTRKLYADFVNQGKVVVLEVFFTTCPPCATYAPHWQSLYETVKNQYPGKVEFIMLSDKSADTNVAVAQYKTSKGLTMVAAGSDGGSLSAVQPYKSGQFGPFYGTPTFIVIAPGTGEVLFDVRGSGATATMDSIHQKITQLLVPECHILSPQGDTLQNYRLRLDVPSGSPVFYDVTEGVFTLNNFPGLPGLPYFQISPSKNDDPLNGVSTYDLVQINKQILGVSPFQEPWQFVAADANNSGTVSTLDIVELRKLILGIYDTLPNSTSWVFTPATDTIGAVFCPEFMAVKRGDVNGNAAPDSLGGSDDRDADTWAIYPAEQQMEPGQIYSIPIFTEKNGAWTGLQGAFRFDPAALEIIGIRSETLEGWDENAWFAKNGRLSWSWVNVEPVQLDSRTPMLTLECRALQAGIFSEMLVVETAPLRAEVYDAAGVRFPINWNQKKITSNGLLLSPNPAYEQVHLKLKSEISETTTIQVIDFQGRVVLQQNLQLEIGSNRIVLRPTALPAGMYTVRVGAFAAKLLWQP